MEVNPPFTTRPGCGSILKKVACFSMPFQKLSGNRESGWTNTLWIEGGKNDQFHWNREESKLFDAPLFFKKKCGYGGVE